MQLERYHSFEEKKEIFENDCCHHRLISNALEFDEWYASRPENGCYYRGVKNAAYKNYTSAQREYITHDYKSVGPLELVKFQIDSLRASCDEILQKICSSNGIPCSDLYIMSFAQHFGGISQFLDFSKSLDVALYFACDGAAFTSNGSGDNDGKEVLDNYISLYSLADFYIKEYNLENQIQQMAHDLEKQEFEQRHNECTQMSADGLRYVAQSDKGIRETYFRNLNEALVKHISIDGDLKNTRLLFMPNEITNIEYMDHSIPYVLRISNLNVIAQQGCFIFHNKGITPFEDFLSCLDIHKSLIPYIKKRYLVPHNINKESLFPDYYNIVEKSLFDARAEAVQPAES